MSRHRSILGAGLIVLACVLPASAQTNPGDARMGNLPWRQPFRVETQFSATIPDGGTDLDAQIASGSKARLAIYQMAAKECDLLKSAFGTDCHIVNVNVSSMPQNRFGGPASIQIVVNGSASFELPAIQK